MTAQDAYVNFLKKLPGVSEPIRRLSFKSKIKWTGLTLLLYFVMGQIPLYGIGQAAFEQFQLLAMIMGSSFGSLMTLGIGPIVTASIILQLLVGSKLIGWDLGTETGRVMFQGTQKLMAIFLSFVEGLVFVMMGAIPASAPGLVAIVVLQLALGGIIIIFMDELISKWGFGSGVSLFIAGGVSKTIIVRAINPLVAGCSGFGSCIPTAANPPAGALPFAITAIGSGELLQAFFSLMPLMATLIVFFLVIYANAIKVEIPLAFGSVRGFGRRWPLKFFYTSNLPVILVAALLANVQLMARMLYEKGITWFGTFNAEGHATGGLIYFFIPPRSEAIMGMMIFIGLFALIGAAVAYFTQRKGVKITFAFAVLGGIIWFALVSSMGLTSLMAVNPMDIARMVTYSFFMVAGAVVFSYFWMATAGMDSASVAKQIESTGMQIPGYRRDVRIIERVLDRYIPGLTILGGAAVGFLAAYADFTGALGTGTGILLATMIIYNLYEELAQQHMEDMHPALRKLMGK
jgi:preprotein translocase subunit SecY